MEIKVPRIGGRLLLLAGCLCLAPQLAAAFVSEPHQSLLDHYFQPAIAEYLATLVDLDRESLGDYCQSLTDLPRSNGVTALEAYRLFILKNDTRLPPRVAEGYLRAGLLANYRVLSSRGGKLFVTIYSHADGLSANEAFGGTVPREIDSIITTGETPPAKGHRSLLRFATSPLPQIPDAGYFIMYKEENHE
jgi:hypothetical protein